MKQVSEIYGRNFFGKRYKLSWRAVHVIDALEKVFNLDKRAYASYIDVGCAVGDLVAEALRRGYDAYGIEGANAAFEFLECPLDRVYIGDLRSNAREFMTVERYTVLSCFEVAEHLEEAYADIFVDNLTSLSYNIVMSAAPPGQKGHYHVNCQLPEYWDAKFKSRGYKRLPYYEGRFKAVLEPWKHKDGIRAFYNNCLIYRHIWEV